MVINSLLSHAILSFLPGLFGIILGFGSGFLIAREILLVLPQTQLKRLIVLPWRTGVLTLELLVMASPIIIRQIGIGTNAGWVTMGLALFFLALPYGGGAVTSVRYSSPLTLKMMAGLRTLLIASVALALIVGLQSGAGGAGGLFWSGGGEQTLFQGFLIVFILALIVDIGIGAIQYTVKLT